MAPINRTPCAKERTVNVLLSRPSRTSHPGSAARRWPISSPVRCVILQLLSQPPAYVVHELGPRLRIAFESAGHGAGHHARLRLLDATDAGAQMQRLNHDGHALWLHDFRHKIGDLTRQPFLHL